LQLSIFSSKAMQQQPRNGATTKTPELVEWSWTSSWKAQDRSVLRGKKIWLGNSNRSRYQRERPIDEFADESRSCAGPEKSKELCTVEVCECGGTRLFARSLAPSRERGTEGRKTATVGATDTQRLLTSGSVAGSTGSSLCPSVRTNWNKRQLWIFCLYKILNSNFNSNINSLSSLQLLHFSQLVGFTSPFFSWFASCDWWRVWLPPLSFVDLLHVTGVEGSVLSGSLSSLWPVFVGLFACLNFRSLPIVSISLPFLGAFFL
jgi:hypothetical protein